MTRNTSEEDFFFFKVFRYLLIFLYTPKFRMDHHPPPRLYKSTFHFHCDVFCFFCAMLPTVIKNFCQQRNSVEISNELHLREHSSSLFELVVNLLTVTLTGVISISLGVASMKKWMNTKIPCWLLFDLCYCILHIVEEPVNSLHWTCIGSCYCGVLFLPVQFCF